MDVLQNWTTYTCCRKNGHTVKQSHCHCETVYDQLTPHKTEYEENDLKTSKLAHYLADVTGSSTVRSVRSSFNMCIRTAIYGSFPVLFLSIYEIHIITEMLCIDNIDFFDD